MPEVRQHAYEYVWIDEQQDDTYTSCYDDTKRVKAFYELVNMGKPAVPTLVKILTSEKGEYPEEFADHSSGVREVLEKLADTEVSKSLVQPFQQKVEKISEKNQDPYNYQIYVIANIWKKYPVQETIPALYAAITKKTNEKYPFSEYDRENFFDALARIGTKEAITAILEAGKQDANLKHESGNNHAYAIRSLEKSMKENGKKLYEIYSTTRDEQIKRIAAEALDWRRLIYWLIRKLHL